MFNLQAIKGCQMKTIKLNLIGLASIMMCILSGCEKAFSSMSITNNSPYTYAVYLDDNSKGEVDPNNVMSFTIDPGIYQLKAIQMKRSSWLISIAIFQITLVLSQLQPITTF